MKSLGKKWEQEKKRKEKKRKRKREGKGNLHKITQIYLPKIKLKLLLPSNKPYDRLSENNNNNRYVNN